MNHIFVIRALHLAYMLVLLAGYTPLSALILAFKMRRGMNGLYRMGWTQEDVKRRFFEA